MGSYWLNSYLDLDALWLDESLNWDDVIEVYLAEEFILPSLFSGSFFATNLTLDAQTKLAYLDFLLLLEADIRRAYFGLLSLVFCDESLAFNAKTPNLNFFF